MSQYEISFPDYIIFEEGQIKESHLPDHVILQEHALVFKKGSPIQLHVVLSLKNNAQELRYVFEDQAQVDLIETRILENAVLNRTMEVGEDAHVNIFNENNSENKELITFKDQGSVGANSFVQLGYAELSDGCLEAAYHYDLDGEGADVRVRMATLAKEEEKKHYEVLIKHNKPHTTGIMDNYGVTKDKGHLVIDGIGTITKGQHGSASHQTNKIMVFDPECYASANPYLFIDEFDVKASHAAGVGKMDEDHLYYLQSRGLSSRDAMQLITYGYLKPVIEVVDNEMLKERFETVLSKVGA